MDRHEWLIEPIGSPRVWITKRCLILYLTSYIMHNEIPNEYKERSEVTTLAKGFMSTTNGHQMTKTILKQTKAANTAQAKVN